MNCKYCDLEIGREYNEWAHRHCPDLCEWCNKERNQFAAAALMGLVSTGEWIKILGKELHAVSYGDLSKTALGIADAMMKARKGEE